MLDSYENRKGYALAFGLSVNKCLDILLGGYEDIFGLPAAAKIYKYPSYLSCKYDAGDRKVMLHICIPIK